MAVNEATRYFPGRMMMVRICVVSLLAIVTGCDPYDVITVVNRSDKTISVEIDPDTVLGFPSENKTEAFYVDVIKPGDSLRVIKMGGKGWSSMIHRSTNKKLNLFVFDIDSLNRYQSIDTLIRRRSYRHFEFSKESLDSLKWSVEVR